MRVEFVIRPKTGSVMDLSSKNRDSSLSLRNLKDVKNSFTDKFKMLQKPRKPKSTGENQVTSCSHFYFTKIKTTKLLWMIVLVGRTSQTNEQRLQARLLGRRRLGLANFVVFVHKRLNVQSIRRRKTCKKKSFLQQ